MSAHEPPPATLTIAEIHREVWSHPLKTLSLKWGLTGTKLAELCDQHCIPRPAMGYWQRSRLGSAEAATPLPEGIGPDTPIAIRAADKLSEERSAKTFARIAYEDAHLIVVADKLIKPHRLVVSTKAGFANATTRTQHEYLLRPGGLRSLSTAVSKACVARALRLWDALLKGTVGRDLAIDVVGNERYQRKTILTIDGYRFELKLRERQSQEARLPDEYEKRFHEPGKEYFSLMPTGSLYFHIEREGWGMDAEIKEGKQAGPLEGQLNDLFRTVYRLVDELDKRAERAAQDDRERRVEATQRAEVERLAEQEKRELDGLLEAVDNWDKSRKLRAFAEDYRQRVDLPPDELDKQLAWILGHADRLDPLPPLATGRGR